MIGGIGLYGTVIVTFSKIIIFECVECGNETNMQTNPVIVMVQETALKPTFNLWNNVH